MRGADLQRTAVQRCAIYTRKSTDDRLERDYNSLASQRDICSAYIQSQRHKGWIEVPERYDDPAQSGGTLERPGLEQLMDAVERGTIHVIVIYKIDRLTRSLGDFVRLMDLFEKFDVSFVSVTQNFDTSDSMGRLVLNILLTFAQFEREMVADRVRDKILAMKQRGRWTGGPPPYGYDVVDGRLIVNPIEADQVRHIFRRFLELGSYVALKRELQAQGMRTKIWTNRKGTQTGGGVVSSGMVYNMLSSRFYVGEVPHYDRAYPGEHEALIDRALWDEVQALRACRSMYKLIDGPSPNLLLGLFFDGHGRRMTIADDSTRGRRYRYYLSDQARWAARAGLKRMRVEANGIEQLVLASLATMLAEPARVRAALVSLGKYSIQTERLVRAGKAAAARLDRAPIAQRRLMLKALLARVEVTRADVSILVRCSGLEAFLAWDGKSVFQVPSLTRQADDFVYLLHVPAAVARIERTLALPLDRPNAAEIRPPKPALVALLREARRAKEIVDEERTESVVAIAARFRRQPGNFARLVRLNYLAPDIVAAIMDGLQPASLTRKNLLQASLPMDWAQQRQLLGFASRADVQTVDLRY
jgi:DNA invertase Pin-like site-specific DNA recombinase